MSYSRDSRSSFSTFSALVAGLFFFFFFNDTATTEIYTLSLHDALPIFDAAFCSAVRVTFAGSMTPDFTRSSNSSVRSEEHTSELQSRLHLVCRLLLEKKKKKTNHTTGIA